MASDPLPDNLSSGNPTSSFPWVASLGPYIVMICGGVVFYYFAYNISYAAVPGQMGPDRWPKMVIGIFIVVCAFEIVRRIMAARRDRPVLAQTDDLDSGFSQEMEAHPLLVVGASIATVAYLLLLDYLGFFVATIFYTGSIMWLGGIRRPIFVSFMSLAMSVAFAVIFLKLIYVALPLGEGPFEQISLFVLKILGV